MYVIATVICPNFHFSVSPHVPFLNLLFEQIAIPTSIYLQNLASIQPRTSLVKFARSPCTDPPGALPPGSAARTSKIQRKSTDRSSRTRTASSRRRGRATRNISGALRKPWLFIRPTFSDWIPTFAPFESNLETTKSTSAKRHPGEKQCAGEETIRQQRRSGAWRKAPNSTH